MSKINVNFAGDLAATSLKAATASIVLFNAFVSEWKRITQGVAEVDLQAAGALAVDVLKAAMTNVNTRTDLRANIIGMFCNQWNLTVRSYPAAIAQPVAADTRGPSGPKRSELSNGPQWSWELPIRWAPGQFGSLDRFVVVNSTTNFAAQGFSSNSAAKKGLLTFIDHEMHCGRFDAYDVRPIPAKLHNRIPNHWKHLMEEGEEIRQKRIDRISQMSLAMFSSSFVDMADRYIEKAGNAQSVDWSALHEEYLGASIGTDVREPTLALAELLHSSPGAVTHAEQDAVCMQLETLLAQHGRSNEHMAVRSDQPRG